MRIAAIDVGTNTVLMLVAARASDGTLDRLEDHGRIARLGQGVDATGVLAPEAMERTLAVLRDYRAIADRHGARIVAAGTSALRDARNTGDFLARARDVLGAPLEVVSGEREAELTFAGGLDGLTLDDARPIVLVDVGGGSTEIVTGTRRHIATRVSLALGSVRLHERHADADPPSADAIAAMLADVDRAWHAAAIAVPDDAQFIALAGTATTLAAVALDARDIDPSRVRGATLTLAQAREAASRLASMTTTARRALTSMDPGRADVIAAGATLLVRIAQLSNARDLIVSDGGVRVGLALESLASHGTVSRFQDS